MVQDAFEGVAGDCCKHCALLITVAALSCHIRLPCISAVLRKQAGPARDALPTAAPDTSPPSVPTGLSLTAYTTIPNSLHFTWSLSTDDRAVAGYAVQVVRTLTDDPTTGAGLFTTANLATALNSGLARFNGMWLGNAEVALLEGLDTGYRYHARLIARDLAGKWSAWSAPVSVLLL